MIFFATLFLTKGTALYNAALKGDFTENTAGANLSEESQLIISLELEDTFLPGSHPSNAVSLTRHFPEDKERLISELKLGMQEYDDEFLTSRPKKGTEGLYIS